MNRFEVKDQILSPDLPITDFYLRKVGDEIQIRAGLRGEASSKEVVLAVVTKTGALRRMTGYKAVTLERLGLRVMRNPNAPPSTSGIFGYYYGMLEEPPR